jgi:hypothetical protein
LGGFFIARRFIKTTREISVPILQKSREWRITNLG